MRPRRKQPVANPPPANAGAEDRADQGRPFHQPNEWMSPNVNARRRLQRCGPLGEVDAGEVLDEAAPQGDQSVDNGPRPRESQGGAKNSASDRRERAAKKGGAERGRQDRGQPPAGRVMPRDQVLPAEEGNRLAERRVQGRGVDAGGLEADEAFCPAQLATGHEVVAQRALPRPVQADLIENVAADCPGAAPDHVLIVAAEERHDRRVDAVEEAIGQGRPLGTNQR